MDPTIKKILKENHVDGIFHTHVSLIRPRGKFQFNRQTMEEFWEAYCKMIEENDAIVVGIAEKPQQYLPVIVDIDLRIRDDGGQIGDTLYTEQQLKIVVETYQSALRQIVDNCTEDDLICVALEKQMYQQTKNEITYFKHGFHLHFPNIFLNKTDQEIQLIPRVQQTLKETKVFENLGVEDSGTVIDKICCKVPWLMYGSRKSEEHQPYKVTKIFDSELTELSLEQAFKHYQLFDRREQLIPLKGQVKYYLPRILSIIPYGRSTKEIKRGIISPIKEKLKKEKKSSTSYRKMGVEEALNIARKLLPMLADFRADDHNEWMTIGWVLYNISDGHPDALDLWCEFSARCEEKYDENVCIYQWDRMTKKDLTIGTLRHFASIDNTAEYKKFKEEQSNKHILASLEGSHNDVAKALFEEYGDEFVCASFSNKIWFQFIHHTWEQIEEGVFLREKISGKIVNKYVDTIKTMYDEMRDCQDKAREAMINARIKQIQKMIGNLKNSTYKNNVMKECLSQGTLVSLSTGLTMKIEDMVKNQKILSWHPKKQGITIEKQLFHLEKGEKQCIQITLIDGSTLICTPDHKILCNNDWVEAQTLKNGDFLYGSIKGPCYEYKIPQEIWKLETKNHIFTNSNEPEYLKSLAFARILGFMLSDGSIACKVIFALQMDANAFVDDIELITEKRPKISIIKPIQYSVCLPICLVQDLSSLGHRTTPIPDFILDENCPLEIVREFLAGFWGRDGQAPTFNSKQNLLISTCLSKSKELQYENELSQTMENIKILLTRFSINNVSYRTSKHEKYIEKTLSIGMKDYLTFFEKISVRYCSEKAIRFNIVASYRKALEITKKQYNQVVDRVKKLSEYEHSIDEAYKQICDENIVLFPDAIKPRYNDLIKNTHKFKNMFPKPREYLKSIGVLYFFTNNDCITSECIPPFFLKIIDIRDAGIHKVYDINVQNLHSFVSNGIIVHNCMEVFYDPRFREKLDADPYLIAFRNGVYDLRTNIFRPGRPEDFISKSMPINYIEYSEDDEKIHEVMTFLEQIFPDKSVRKYFMDVSSDIFVGGNHEKIVLFWTGDGDNGKSVMQQFFEQMLGKLAIKFNTTVITGKKPSAGAAFADLARAGGGVRWAVLEEPDGDESINIGIFKHLSGNDSFYARDLFEKGKDGREIIPMFKLIFICLGRNTAISLPFGVSASIEKFVQNYKLLGWNNKDGIIPITQDKLIKKGIQDCIKLTLQDGRTIICTPRHKFLTSTGTWIEAQDINIGKTMLKMGPTYPKCDDMFDDYDYPFLDYNLQKQSDRFKTGALCRLLGYIDNRDKTIYVEHKIDADIILDDIELLSSKRSTSIRNHEGWQIFIPEELKRKMSLGNINNPEFIFDQNCPKFMIREYIAGLYGRNGIVPFFPKKLGALRLVCSKIQQYLSPSIEKIKQLMCTKFGIKTHIVTKKYRENDYHIFLDTDNILLFANQIGFRYCCRKIYCLTAASSMLNYKNSIIAQNQGIINRARTLYKKGHITQKFAFERCVQETKGIIDKNHVISYNHPYKMPSIDCESFLEKTGLISFCDQFERKGKINYCTSLPCYQLCVINRENYGKEEVYDIKCENPYNNFIAEGLVAHNCNKLPHIKYADKAVWNRVRVIPFESTFCRPEDPAPETYEEQLKQKRFPMDKQFGKKIPGMVEAFACILLQHRQKNTVRIEPDKVRTATEIYRKQNDIYRQFVDECIAEDSDKTISLAEVYNLFKAWFHDSLPGHTVPVKNEVEEYFIKLWGNPETGKKWKGYRQRTLKDDIAAGDAVIFDPDTVSKFKNDENGVPPM